MKLQKLRNMAGLDNLRFWGEEMSGCNGFLFGGREKQCAKPLFLSLFLALPLGFIQMLHWKLFAGTSFLDFLQ